MENRTLFRDISIDILKGIAILAVVIGHSFYTGTMIRVIYLFHLPLFFVIAGYLFDNKKYIGHSNLLIEHSAKRLLLPGMVVCLIVYPFSFWFTPDVLSAIYGIGIPIQLRLSGLVFTVQPLLFMIWFLYCLFVLRLLLFGFITGVEKLHTPLWMNIGMALGVAYLGVMIGRGFPLPWSVDLACVGLFFAYVGNIERSYEGKKYPHFAIIWMLVSLLLIGFDSMYGGLNLNVRYYRYPLLTFIGALAIIYWIKKLVVRLNCKWTSYLRFILAYLGANSLVIMLTHMVVLEGNTGWWLVGLRLIVCCGVIEALARNKVLKNIFGVWNIKEILQIYPLRITDK